MRLLLLAIYLLLAVCHAAGAIDALLANEWTQIRSDPVPSLSVDTLGAFWVEIAVARSESDLDRSG